MWRSIALLLVLFAGCADSQAYKQPIRLPNADFLLEDNDSFFRGPPQTANPPAPSNR